MRKDSIHHQLTSGSGELEFREAEGPTVSVAAFGDLAFHGPVLEDYQGKPSRSVFSHVRDDLSDTDMVTGNLESVLVRHPYSPLGGKACLVSGLEALADLESAGFNVLTLANNHILDAGPDGLAECLEGIADSKMMATGAGMDAESARLPASFSSGSFKFKVFAYCYGAGQIAAKNNAGCNEALLKLILKDLSSFCTNGDIPIVCLHMDAEFQPTPAPDRIEMCRRLAESGVPLVLCHHPHVVQGMEIHQGGLIAYSLGNYVFPILPYMKNNSAECHLTFHLKIVMDKNGPVSAQVKPAVIDKRGCPGRPSESEFEQILALVADRSRILDSPDEVESNYYQMIEKYSLATMKNIYWALGEGDWKRIRMNLASLKISRTKRNWILHYLKRRLVAW